MAILWVWNALQIFDYYSSLGLAYAPPIYGHGLYFLQHATWHVRGCLSLTVLWQVLTAVGLGLGQGLKKSVSYKIFVQAIEANTNLARAGQPQIDALVGKGGWLPGLYRRRGIGALWPALFASRRLMWLPVMDICVLSELCCRRKPLSWGRGLGQLWQKMRLCSPRTSCRLFEIPRKGSRCLSMAACPGCILGCWGASECPSINLWSFIGEQGHFCWSFEQLIARLSNREGFKYPYAVTEVRWASPKFRLLYDSPFPENPSYLLFCSAA